MASLAEWIANGIWADATGRIVPVNRFGLDQQVTGQRRQILDADRTQDEMRSLRIKPKSG